MSRFKRALRRRDQITFDSLWADVSKHLAAAGYAENATPLETFLLCMLLEERKNLNYLQVQLEEIQSKTPAPNEEDKE
jgi:hypothetical protein